MRSSSVLYRSIRTRHLGVVSTCSATCRGSVGRCEPPAAVRAGLVESRRAPPTAASATASADFQRRFLSSPTPSGTSSSNSDGSSPLQKKAGDGGSDDSISSSSSSSSSEVQVQEYLPVDFGTSAKIDGEESHVVTIELKPGECVRAESGSMIFMTESIQMNTTLGAGASSAFKRMLTGQNVFLTDFTCQPTKTSETSGTPGEESGTLCLGTDFPSKILRLNLQDMANGTLICQRGAYLASNPTVDIEMEFTKSLSAGFFGGQGFVLQRLSGEGDVLVKAGGTLVAKDLQPNETLRVTSGSIVAFENTIDYDIQMMPGIKNAMFGGEGLFVTKAGIDVCVFFGLVAPRRAVRSTDLTTIFLQNNRLTFSANGPRTRVAAGPTAGSDDIRNRATRTGTRHRIGNTDRHGRWRRRRRRRRSSRGRSRRCWRRRRERASCRDRQRDRCRSASHRSLFGYERRNS